MQLQQLLEDIFAEQLKQTELLTRIACALDRRLLQDGAGAMTAVNVQLLEAIEVEIDDLDEDFGAAAIMAAGRHVNFELGKALEAAAVQSVTALGSRLRDLSRQHHPSLIVERAARGRWRLQRRT